MFLAGFNVPDSDVLELARLVNDPRLADCLETAYGNGTRVLALDVPKRETILQPRSDSGPRARPYPCF